MKFEGHITVPNEHTVQLEKLGYMVRWNTSHITDDPVLGPGPKFYFTAYDKSYVDLKNRMDFVISRLRSQGVKVLRAKIEFIVYDERFE